MICMSNSTTLSAHKLWVICNHPPRSDFSAGFDNIFLDKQEAEVKAEKMSQIIMYGCSIKYYVQTLFDAIDDAKGQAATDAITNERG